MNSREDYIDQCIDPSKRPLDRNRGLQHSIFGDALKRASGDYDYKEPIEDGVGVRRNPGTDIADPYGSQKKPEGVPVWDHPPLTPAEEAIYYGNHAHSESNPMGLHSHVPGGSPTGAHTHGPQNRFGSHHHKSDNEAIIYGITIDGPHTHDGKNYPDGGHEHCPENFG